MSISRLRQRLTKSGDTGLGMIEVLVALMVFSVLAVGMLFALTTMTRLAGDTESREVAVSLAAQEIDKVRAVPDAFDVLDATTTIGPLSGITYTVTRVQNWVSTTGSTANCGGGGGNLQYKSVDVKVSWNSQLVLKNPVEATTALAPSSRINDPSYGTIIVSVQGADGTGRAGVTVTVKNTATGAAIASVDPTDSDGCSYVLKVPPGTYQVQVSKSGYIDYSQIASPSKTYPITAGSTQPVSFSYDKQANYTLKYASNFAGTAKLPDVMTTNYLSSSGNYSTASMSTPIALYPKTEGYAAITGAYTSTSSISSGCLSVDPVTWAAGKVGAVNMAAGVRTPVGVAAGSSGPLPIPMGVVQVAWPAQATSITVRGIAAATGPGDPGCAQPTDYTFSYATPPATGTVVSLAVPFGSYQVYCKISGALTLSTTATNATQGEVTGNIITLDPRLPG